ncbi:helix-turn-helix domain-containing protein [Candidatus Woesearchaeota archaeon]|nr:helix-turn-helix domain-containing protein [Candidatus Woesearchaeota archaeon]
MAKDPFLLVSLEENESKALAQVISNDTARKILDLLSKKESATETDIAKELKLPLSTVHYNLQALVKANLVKSEEFHYSEKGKEVNHYSLANKLIIIAPKGAKTESFKDKLKAILPISIIVLAVGGVIQLFNKLMLGMGSAKLMAAAPSTFDYVAQRSADVVENAVPEATEAAPLLMKTAAEGVVGAAQNITENITEPVVQPVINVIQQTQPTNIALWFLIGAAFTIILLVIWYWFVTKKKKNN